MKKVSWVFIFVSIFCFAALPTSGFAKSSKGKKSTTRSIRAKVKKAGLRVLPEGSSAIRSSRKKKGKKSGNSRSLFAQDVSGTPPALVDIPQSDPAEIFWQPGLIEAIANGDATPDQCNDFFAGNSDGASGGLGACHMAESVGQALQLASEGGTSLCYMKNFPTTTNLQAGGVTVVSGDLPGGAIENLFASPKDGIRTVKVQVRNFPTDSEHEEESGPSDQDIFIRVYPQDGSTFYKTELFFCNGDDIEGSDQITILKNGKMTARNENLDSNGTFYSEFEGTLALEKKELVYDASKPRTAIAGSVNDNGTFKVQMSLRGKQVDLKFRLGNGDSEDLTYGASIVEFSGDSPEEIRFLQGAFRNLEPSRNDGGFVGSTEYRDAYYASAPDGKLLSKIPSESELLEDSFYDSDPESEFDFSDYSCSETADIVVTMDFSNETLLNSVSTCGERPFEGMNFCHENELIRAADENYFDTCIQE